MAGAVKPTSHNAPQPKCMPTKTFLETPIMFSPPRHRYSTVEIFSASALYKLVVCCILCTITAASAQQAEEEEIVFVSDEPQTTTDEDAAAAAAANANANTGEAAPLTTSIVQPPEASVADRGKMDPFISIRLNRSKIIWEKAESLLVFIHRVAASICSCMCWL